MKQLPFSLPLKSPHPLAPLWVAALCCGLGLAYLVTGLLPSTPPPMAPASRAAAPAVAQGESGTKIIMDRNILRLAIPKPRTVSTAPPYTDPDTWTVTGVFVRGARSAAIVKTPRSTEVVFEQSTLHGWKLIEVLSSGTTWEKGGLTRFVALNAPPNKLLKQSGSNAPKAQRSAATELVKFSEKAVIDKETAKKIIKNPVSLLEQALYKPYKEGDKVIGFSVRNIKDNSILKQIGLKNDDVLMRLNGEEIKDPVSLLQAYSGLEGAKNVSIDVKRGGQVKSILLQVK